MADLYAKATGHLQGNCEYVAREIESVANNFEMDLCAKQRLIEASWKLIDASVKAEELVSEAALAAEKERA